ncbi:MAG: galactose mutarotase, partial [Planctomycetales bacterium]|nr:galactose mutarotase [Planctomycetales bacterium]
MDDGREVQLYTLTNRQGLIAKVTNFGATLASLEVPDRDGKLDSIVLSFDTFEALSAPGACNGAIMGRFANRIAGGKFSLDGVEYTLATNNGANHLHGGKVGFNQKLWQAEASTEPNDARVTFRYRSPEGEEGYPGNLEVAVEYTLTDENELRLVYTATTDRPTILNLTNHAYFNLAGHASGDVLQQELQLPSEKYLLSPGLIPTGELADVADTPYDFRAAKPIGRDIGQQEGLYDICFVVPHGDLKQRQVILAARAKDPGSGRVLEILTDQPGIQLYTANHLNGVVGAGGAVYEKHHAFCLETQHFPDSPHRPEFPSVELRPGETFQSTTIHRFLVE